MLHFDQYREMGLSGRRFYEAHYAREVFVERLTGILAAPVKKEQ